MTLISDLRAQLESLSVYPELDVDLADLPTAADRLGDDAVLASLTCAARLANDLERVRVALSGVAARRSARELGHEGLAAKNGHRSPASLIQQIGGGTKAEADRHVRLGTALLEDVPDPRVAVDPDAASATPPWHDALRRALLSGTLTPAQHDAIYRGLGEPPPIDGRPSEAVVEVWSIAAEQLVVEASGTTVEDLLQRARHVRDLLDPVGAQERFDRRHEKRSFRLTVDHDGQQRAHIVFDDEMAAWVRSMIDAALRPRRGGPRFVDAAEAQDADRLVKDPRSNEQLTYDLMMDVIRAGALADAKSVFGARQPGVRLVVVSDGDGPLPRDPFGRLLSTGHVEDGGMPLPGSVIERALCGVGSLAVTVDERGNPLDVGREQRLYTPRQRVALAVRDGGCMFPGCGLPPSYCEAHHCDHWLEHGGRTDIDRGILLCRFHHMLLHNRGWQITRDRHGPFMLQPPGGEGDTVVLTSKSAAKWAWNPPPPPDLVQWRERRADPAPDAGRMRA